MMHDRPSPPLPREIHAKCARNQHDHVAYGSIPTIQEQRVFVDFRRDPVTIRQLTDHVGMRGPLQVVVFAMNAE